MRGRGREGERKRETERESEREGRESHKQGVCSFHHRGPRNEIQGIRLTASPFAP